jgi:hypothetical protein
MEVCFLFVKQQQGIRKFVKNISSTFANVLKITTFAVQNFEPFRLNKRKQERFPPAGVTLKKLKLCTRL